MYSNQFVLSHLSSQLFSPPLFRRGRLVFTVLGDKAERVGVDAHEVCPYEKQTTTRTAYPMNTHA